MFRPLEQQISTPRNLCGSLDLNRGWRMIIALTGNFPGWAAVRSALRPFTLGVNFLRETAVLLLIDAVAVGAVVIGTIFVLVAHLGHRSKKRLRR